MKLLFTLFITFNFLLIPFQDTFSQEEDKDVQFSDYKIDKKEIEEKLDDMEDKVYDGWGDLSGSVGNEVDKLVSKDSLTSFLFNELGKYSSSFHLGGGTIENVGGNDAANINYGVGLSLSIGRKAIAHKRIRNIYSIIDNFRIGINPSIAPGWGPLFASLSGNIGFEFTNIRQISPSDYKGLPRLKKLVSHLKKASDKEKFKKPSADVIKATNDQYKSFMPPSDRRLSPKFTWEGFGIQSLKFSDCPLIQK